jgi:hypothetical protein
LNPFSPIWGQEGEWEWEEEEEESRHPNGNAKGSFFNPFLPIWGEEGEWANGNAKVRNILTLSHLSGERRGSGSKSQDILIAMLK